VSFRKHVNRIINLVEDFFLGIPATPRNILFTIIFLSLAYLSSGVLINHTGAENNSALVFVLAVVLISLCTTGYLYGITASVFSVFFINYAFMYPYDVFTLNYTGYPIAALSMLTISCVVCALTSRVKLQKQEAARREENTKRLYQLNEQLNQEKREIQLASDRETIRANILRAVSHDLRTPLTSISGAVSVLISSPEISDKNKAMLSGIKDDADTLITMVENLLSVTRIQDGSLPVKKQEDMLEEVAGDAVLTIQRRFPQAKIGMDLSDDLLYLPMDSMLIKQVMVNLLENSVRHSGNPGSISLRLFRQDNWAVVEVQDQGKGLPPEVYQAVQAGRQIDRDRTGDSTRGMGIGLSVCQSIIKAHGGFFAAENRPEGGAVFRFGLPMEESPNE